MSIDKLPSSPIASRFKQDLQLKGLRERTQQSYCRALRKFTEFIQKEPDSASEDELRRYLLYIKNERQFSSSTINVAQNGLKNFFKITCLRDWPTLKFLRVKGELKLPTVLTIGEVHTILKLIEKPSMACFFTVIYSLGLRLQEGLNLQIEDIDSKRMMVHIHRGKGAKDRMIPLPETTLLHLREYYKSHRNPRWIFPSEGKNHRLAKTSDKPMSESSVQGVIKAVLGQLNWDNRGVSTHTLRHCYATHLLEAGVSLKLIQKYMGHAHLTSTMVYLHVTTVGEEGAIARITVPEEFRAFARSHPKECYKAIFEAAYNTMVKLAKDPKYIGSGKLGMTGVLHTWGRDVGYHPHVHFIVPGGAIGKDGVSWLKSRDNFFIPVQAASLIYRAKYKAAMKRAGLLDKIDQEVSSEVWSKAWLVNSQAVGDGRLALKYLAPYVFRVAIGNHRIVSVTDQRDANGETTGKVTFLVKRTRTNRYQSMTVSAEEFLRRYLQHVLPRGFQKVRHFGFAHPRAKTNWEWLNMLVTVSINLVYVLTVLAKPTREPRSRFPCSECGGEMTYVMHIKYKEDTMIKSDTS